MTENYFFYHNVTHHATNKNTADGNCFQITISWFGIQWVSMYQFSYFASNKGFATHLLLADGARFLYNPIL